MTLPANLKHFIFDFMSILIRKRKCLISFWIYLWLYRKKDKASYYALFIKKSLYMQLVNTSLVCLKEILCRICTSCRFNLLRDTSLLKKDFYHQGILVLYIIHIPLEIVLTTWNRLILSLRVCAWRVNNSNITLGEDIIQECYKISSLKSCFWQILGHFQINS